MIFGMTHAQKRRRQQGAVARKTFGVARFAYWPRRLHDGRGVWWQPYWEFYETIVGPDGDLILHRTKGGCAVTHRSLTRTAADVHLRMIGETRALNLGHLSMLTDETTELLSEYGDTLFQDMLQTQ